MAIIAVVLGWFSHHLMILAERNASTGELPHPLTYVKKHPYKFMMSIVGAVLGYMFMVIQFSDIATLNNKDVDLLYLMAMFGAGYVPYNIIDKMGRVSKKKMDDVDKDL